MSTRGRGAGARAAALGLALLLGACATEPVALDVQHLSGWGSYTPEPYVTVLNAPPAGPYASLARITASGAAGLSRSQALAALEAKAREIGANAIVVTDETEAAPPTLAFNPAGGTYNVAPPAVAPKLVGLAIRTP